MDKNSLKLLEKPLDYLLADFQASIGQWQHMNDRMDKELQYYSTLLGSTIAIAGFILQFGQEFLVKVAMVHSLTLIACIAGLRLLRRIIHLTGQSALFSAQVGLIRSCFSDDSRIAPYIILTTAATDKSAHNFTPVSKQLSVRILTISNSLLAITTIAFSPLYFYHYRNVLAISVDWEMVFIITTSFAVTVGLLLFIYQYRISVTKGDQFLDFITKTVQNRRKEIAKKKFIIPETG